MRYEDDDVMEQQRDHDELLENDWEADKVRANTYQLYTLNNLSQTHGRVAVSSRNDGRLGVQIGEMEFAIDTAGHTERLNPASPVPVRDDRCRYCGGGGKIKGMDGVPWVPCQSCRGQGRSAA